MSKIFCITGMHRSGTSLTASWMEYCGLRIDDGSSIGRDIGNPKGHFEDKDFVLLHSDALKFQHISSQGWKLYSHNFLSFPSEYLDRAMHLIDKRNVKYGLWAWKDPRTVLFLKQWKTIIPSLKVLLVWRPCSEVAHSLIKRSKSSNRAAFKITVIDSIKLWISYNTKVYKYKRQYPNDTLLFPLEHIVRYDHLALKNINACFNTDLRYSPINDIYEKKLLTKSSAPLRIRLFCKYYRCSDLEHSLKNLSDSKESASGDHGI